MKPIKSKNGKPTYKKVQETLKSDDFYIVGIGASAGGLEALELFFGNMPAMSNMAFVVIQHLDPTHVGIMPELLQRITTMKVLQATDRQKVKPNCVYVIPPNKSLSILNGALYLFDPLEIRGLRLPIDTFFRSLAEDQKEKSIGIILSGMGSDGSLGIKAIREKNGLILVQEPESAKFDGMPVSATQAVVADIIAPAEKLPAKLIDYLKFNPEQSALQETETKNISNLEKIFILLRNQTGHDFSFYKKNTMFRRIERRKGVHQIDKISNYVHYLQENPAEIDIIFNELLIGVTSFFRDIALWEKLKERILPLLISELPDGHIIRAWVPACSTGEEAYSLAIVFKETLEEIGRQNNLSLQIFATDIDSFAIEKARKAYYSKNIAADVSAKRLSRFFTAEADGYRISSAIREMVVFATQNVIKDPPFTKLDIISCRNMLIYMEPLLQAKLIALFNYSLNSNGLLILGTAESLGNNNVGFIGLDTKLKIFKHSASLPVPELLDFPSSFYQNKTMAIKNNPPQKNIENLQSLADQILIQRFTPASVVVNDKGDILYITGRTGKYLEPVAGKANWNIYAMANEGLQEVLPGAFRKALQTFDPVLIKNIRIASGDGFAFADVTVQQIEKPESIRGLIIVVFADLPFVAEKSTTLQPTGLKNSTGRVKELETELQRSYEELKSTREEMQTSQEELKSINEELQSTNEELQSTNEELTTSKEEMQSLNEELQTVNIELQSKVTDFVKANNDMRNLLNSTEIATLFLDKDLNIRRFTDNLTDIFKLRTTDTGRPFTDLVSELNYPEIETHARQVLKTLTSIETPISTNKNKWYKVRLMPYLTLDDRIEGLVITFSDITVAKQLEMELKAANELLTQEGKINK